MDELTIGIDVSKDHLDAHRLPDGAARPFANTRTGLTQLLRWIGSSSSVARVVFEPTGRYHLELERRLDAAGRPVVKVNPRRAKRFVQALGVRAKTDRADAARLARMGAALALAPQPVRPEVLQDLNDIAARRALVKDRTAAKTRAKGLRLALLSRLNRTRLARIEADLKAIAKAILEIIEANPDLRARHEILVSIAGISEVPAAAILTMMPERGQLDRKQAARLAGLAPVTRQSGRWTGNAFIQGGRAALRQALTRPAVVACRFNPDLKAKYDQLITAGKPPKLAIPAIMRKLIVLANALIRDNRPWQAARA